MLRVVKHSESETEPVLNEMYRRCIVGPLLGSDYVSEVALVVVTHEFLSTLSHDIMPFRPSHRVRASSIDPEQNYAVVCADQAALTLLQGFERDPEHQPAVVSLEFKVNHFLLFKTNHVVGQLELPISCDVCTAQVGLPSSFRVYFTGD